MNAIEENARYAGKLNEEYELVMKAWPYEKQLRSKLAETIAAYITSHGEITILELGSGSGESTEYILRSLEKAGILSGITYISVDLDQALIEKQKRMFEKYNVVYKLIAGDAFSALNQFAEMSIDVFTASWFLHNFKQEQRTILLKNIFRILKPGGLFAVMDKYVPDDAQEEAKLFEDQIQRFNIYDQYGQTELKREMIKHEEEDRSPDFIMREKESIEILIKVGFKNPICIERYLRDVVLNTIK